MKKYKINFIPFGGSPINDDQGFPANSPDLNAIERVFEMWQHVVNLHQPRNVQELIKVARREWKKISITKIRSHIKCQKKRVKWVLQNGGQQYCATLKLVY